MDSEVPLMATNAVRNRHWRIFAGRKVEETVLCGLCSSDCLHAGAVRSVPSTRGGEHNAGSSLIELLAAILTSPNLVNIIAGSDHSLENLLEGCHLDCGDTR